jgi:UDP-N-acetylmuramoylalanine--D-glutamate ligase
VEYKIWGRAMPEFTPITPPPTDESTELITDWKTLFPEPVAVLGYGVEGASTVRHLRRHGYREIVVLDRAAPASSPGSSDSANALPEGVLGIFGTDYLKALGPDTKIRTVFRAPGVRPFVPEIEGFVARGGKLTSQVEAAFSLLGRHRIAGVTGTVGKGTCCSLLAAMLDAAGIPYRLAGNIGVPPLDAVENLPDDALLLLELSSFQLCTLRESPALAIVLRTTTEHLDWHATQREYWEHKANLVRFQEVEDVCIYFADTEGSAWIGNLGAGRKIPVGQGSQGDNTDAAAARLTDTEAVLKNIGTRRGGSSLHIPLSETQMTGSFNLENIAAAASAALELGASVEAVRAGARAFAPLEHRIEFVRETNGIRYFNDSYATRPEATLAAVTAFHDPLGLILGGSEKFADFSELAKALAQQSHLRAIALIGQTADRLESELRAAGAFKSRVFRRCDGLADAVEFLRGEIKSGAILLSPACASFGLFANYKARGKAFKKIVNAL